MRFLGAAFLFFGWERTDTTAKTQRARRNYGSGNISVSTWLAERRDFGTNPFLPRCLGGLFSFAFFASSRFASGLSPCEFLASIADHKLPVFGIIDSDQQRHHLVISGAIRLQPKKLFSEKLLDIHREIDQLIKTYGPEIVAVEDQFYLSNFKSVLKLGQVKGAVILTAARAGIPIVEYSPLGDQERGEPDTVGLKRARSK
jgi:hypothetical protein